MKKNILIILLLLTNACSNFTLTKVIGLETVAPDEFAVTSRPNLSIPDDFKLPLPQDRSIDKESINPKLEENYSKGENTIINRATR